MMFVALSQTGLSGSQWLRSALRTKLPFDRTDRMTGSLLDCIKPRPPRYEGISSFLAGQNRSQKKRDMTQHLFPASAAVQLT